MVKVDVFNIYSVGMIVGVPFDEEELVASFGETNLVGKIIKKYPTKRLVSLIVVNGKKRSNVTVSVDEISPLN